MLYVQAVQPKLEAMEAAWSRLHTISGAATPDQVISYWEGNPFAACILVPTCHQFPGPECKSLARTASCCLQVSHWMHTFYTMDQAISHREATLLPARVSLHASRKNVSQRQEAEVRL